MPNASAATESVTYPSGTLHLTYEPAGAPTYDKMMRATVTKSR